MAKLRSSPPVRQLVLLLLLVFICLLSGCGGDCGPTSDWPHCSTSTSDSAESGDDDSDKEEDKEDEAPTRGESTKKDAGASSGSKPATRDAGRTLLDAAGLTDDAGVMDQTCSPDAVDAGVLDGGSEQKGADGGCEPDH